MWTGQHAAVKVTQDFLFSTSFPCISCYIYHFSNKSTTIKLGVLYKDKYFLKNSTSLITHIKLLHIVALRFNIETDHSLEVFQTEGLGIVP